MVFTRGADEVVTHVTFCPCMVNNIKDTKIQ